MTCKYCGRDSVPVGQKNKMCCNCSGKAPLLPEFVKARDDLRERCGLDRLGDCVAGRMVI